MDRLPITAMLGDYEQQSANLLQGHADGNPETLRLIHQNHPKFLDRDVPWLPLPLSDDEIRAAPFDATDARLTLARWYSFRDWAALEGLVNAIAARTAGIYEFELAAEMVIRGDEDGLRTLLREKPDLVQARSSRVTPHDPPAHRATLLHYVAANGVEGYRQKSPPNAVNLARILLDGGADPNALADMYEGQCTTMSMLVSSSPPAAAGVQVRLVDVLLDYGADPDGKGSGKWVSNVLTALVFGFTGAAHALVARGARMDSLAIAAGLGQLEQAKALIPGTSPLDRHRALALAAQLGHVDLVRMLLDAGEDPNRFNPDGMHSHSTPLHQAALAGHHAVVHLLAARGARLDIKDKIWKGTPLGWAEHGGHGDLANYLREVQARRGAE